MYGEQWRCNMILEKSSVKLHQTDGVNMDIALALVICLYKNMPSAEIERGTTLRKVNAITYLHGLSITSLRS
jgi:hypothetical protein